MEYILTSLDMIAGITDNLINYTFNVSFPPYTLTPRRLSRIGTHALVSAQMASYDMNETM